LVLANAAATLLAQRAGWAVNWALGSAQTQVVVSAIQVVLVLAVMHRMRLYRLESLGWGTGELRRAGRGVILAGLLTVSAVYFAPQLNAHPRWIALASILSVLMVVAARGLVRLFLSRAVHRGGWPQRPTLIVGSNLEAAEVARLLLADRNCGLHPIGTLRSSTRDRLSFDYCAPTLPTLGIARELRATIAAHSVDTVVLVASAFDSDVLKRMIAELRDLPVSIHISSALSEVISSRIALQEVGGIPLISLKGVSLSPDKLRRKRAFDCALAGLVVLLGMPLWLFLAACVRLTSDGPVFYKQERVGRDGRSFLMYKFRSMVADADTRLADLREANEADGPLFKMQQDPRITPVGRWMRKFSLDEFPQLLNVLKGDMSLVGPRPPLPQETHRYATEDWRRLEVVPGMTGLWQVSGRCNLTFKDMVHLDVYYIENWSLSLDLALLARTPAAVLSARGAC